jgi:hypothetical protein
MMHATPAWNPYQKHVANIMIRLYVNSRGISVGPKREKVVSAV